MKAIIRARVSTKGQEEGHSGPPPALCARKGLKMIKTYEHVESSTRGERKEFTAMLAFSSPLEQIDWMLASLEVRRITFERAREIAQAEFDVAEIDPRNGMEFDPAERSAIGSTHVGSSDHTLRVAASISRTLQR